MNTATRSGDNTGAQAYKIGNGFADDAATPFIYTIWDGGGNDTIDATGYADGVEIDLRDGHFSSIGKNGNPDGSRVVWDSGDYDAGNVAIAYGTVIENATGTAHDDRLIGNAADNILRGGAGADVLDGGAGKDAVDYSGDAAAGGGAGIVVDWSVLGNGTVTDGFGDTDTLRGIETVTGTAGADSFTLRGGAQGRTVLGGGGVDSVSVAPNTGDEAVWDMRARKTDAVTGEARISIWDDIGMNRDILQGVEQISMTGGIDFGFPAGAISGFSFKQEFCNLKR